MDSAYSSESAPGALDLAFRIQHMEQIILEIIETLRRGETVDDKALVKLIHAEARRSGADKRSLAKRRLLPFYQRVKREEPERWAAWNVTPELERRLLATLRMKPRRTASGVATITVITKPWPCSGDCLFCPNDLRMPKSYLHAEPACARAEQNCFDPYLQVSARLTALSQMGHATDKIELIVLGGTWSDYPREYQTWFVSELFRALNDDAVASVAANPMLAEGAAGMGGATNADDAAVADADCEAVSGDAENSDGGAARCASADDSAPGIGANAPRAYGASAGDASSADGGAARCASADVRQASSTRSRAAAAFAKVDDGHLPAEVARRRALYQRAGISCDADELAAGVAAEQAVLDATSAAESGAYNRAVRRLYGPGTPWGEVARWQTAAPEELERQQRINETARHRVVGLVIETRPDAVTPESLMLIRRLGCTKIQMGVQSLDQHLLNINGRNIRVEQIERAFSLARLFGFKIHAHFMANLLGATPEADKRDYERFVRDPAFQPDEVKLYPCALIDGSRLVGCYGRGEWRPYTEDELLDVLAGDICVTPAFCRISRMIRDFSSDDIMVGNKKPNLRQLVELRLRERGQLDVQEIRYREIGTSMEGLGELSLNVVPYETPVTSERFLQWVTPAGKIAGFLRLSLPSQAFVAEHAGELPVCVGEAMIREVHVYGMAERVGEDGHAAQHRGLGRKLVEEACVIARSAGYKRINVISAVGTREYYRGLGFGEQGLYQQKEL